MTSNQSLEGITVIDCSQILAGPFCSMLLADHGARVIKVENPNGGDDVSTWGPPYIGKDSAAFGQLNRNKESISLDIKENKGKEKDKGKIREQAKRKRDEEKRKSKEETRKKKK